MYEKLGYIFIIQLLLQEMVRFLVTKLRADVNMRMETQFENQLKGIALILAVRNGDFQMAWLLSKELGLNVNATITLDGRPTTLLHYATWSMIE